MSTRRLSRVVAGLALVAAAALPACVHQVVSSSSSAGGAAPGIAPQLTVESFLRSANCVASANCASKAQDLETMSRLFGTKDGTILNLDPRPNVEKRMYALASLLECQDYKVEGQNIVPGRMGRAVQLVVRMTQGGRAMAVPFTLVRDGAGNWLVESIDMGPLTQRP